MKSNSGERDIDPACGSAYSSIHHDGRSSRPRHSTSLLDLHAAASPARFLFYVLVVCLVNVEESHAQKDPGQAFFDSTSWKWPSFIGGDVSVSWEIPGIHLSPRYTNSFGLMGFGIGGEIRMRPVLVGVIRGISVRVDGLVYRCTTLYGGVFRKWYRLEAGWIFANDVDGSPNKYNSAFVGGGMRIGDILFMEPEIRIVLPISGTFFTWDRGPYPPPPIEERRFALRDLYFVFALKVGFGFN